MNTENTPSCTSCSFLQHTDLGLFVLRASLSLTMLVHGFTKLSGIDFIKGIMAGYGLPEVLAYGVFVGEIIAPLLILVGFRTRAAALLFAFNMFVATFLVHAADLFTLTDHGGWAVELNALYFFGALALVFTGAGRWAISRSHSLD